MNDFLIFFGRIHLSNSALEFSDALNPQNSLLAIQEGGDQFTFAHLGNPEVSNIKIFLKPGGQVYLNGANVRVDRKVSIELLNKTKFLLQENLLPAAQADTPLKQLYFAIQMMIIDASSQQDAKKFYVELVRKLTMDYPSFEFRCLVAQLNDEIEAEREFNALKIIRNKFEIERERWHPEALPLAPEL